jgi:LAGLIDADG-like domain
MIGGLGIGPSTAVNRFAITRGRLHGGIVSQGVNYPHPFFDIAHTYLPVSIKQLFRWCRYYFLTNPLINATVFKLSEYPITDIIIDHDNTNVRERWTSYFQEHLRFRPFQIECGLDYHALGNCAISIGFPFKKYLKCTGCGLQERADKLRNQWVFSNLAFRLTCPRCGTTSEAAVEDFYYKDASGIKLIRWNCEFMEISYNDITGDSTYFYNIPPTIKNDIVIGKKDIVEGIPQVFIQALKQNKGIVFAKDNFFHMKRPTLAQQDRGWGLPIILPTLKDLFYLQIMKKAQECLAPDSLVETTGGLVRAGEIVVGTMVKTHGGNWRPVTQVKTRPMQAERGDYAIKVAVTGLRQMTSTFSNTHPLWVLRRNDVNRRSDTKEHRRSSYVLRNPYLYDFTWVEAGDVSAGDYVGYPLKRNRSDQEIDLARYTNLVATDNFVYSGVSEATAQSFESLEREEHIPHDNPGKVAKRHRKAGTEPKRFQRYLELDEDLAYIAGWYIGDGSIGARRIDFSMGPKDDGEELQAAMERVFGCSFSSYPSKTSKGWMLCAFDTIASDLFTGWIPGHAKDKRIPEEIMQAHDSVVLAFLRGYLEADGYLKDPSRISVCCSNSALLYQLWQLVLSLRCISTLSERVAYDTIITKKDGSEQFIEGGRPIYHWTLTTRSAQRLRQLMNGMPAVEVTSGKSGFFHGEYFAARIYSTEVVDCPEVISMEIAEDHSFCVPGMATHNSVLLEHIIPLRVLFPQAGSATSDPYSTINLVDWRDHVATEIARWRYDQNYIPIMPIPLGNQTIGGDGRALLLTQEIQAWSDQIINGMGVPIEFLRGGMSYAGTNVSMRMLENQFLGFILRHKQLANWVMKQVANFMGWPEASIRFKPFKMADDIQRKAYLFQLNQAQKVSDSTLLADADLDQIKEDEIMLKETAQRLEASKKQQLAMAEIQGEAQVVMAKAQAKAQQTLMQAQQTPPAEGEPGHEALRQMSSQLNAQQGLPQEQGTTVGMDIRQLAQSLAQQYVQLPPEQQQLAMQNLQAQSPELAQMVAQIAQRLSAQQPQPQQPAAMRAATQIDMRPQPAQRSPRRAAAAV